MVYGTTNGSASDGGEIWITGRTDLIGSVWNLDDASEPKKPGDAPRNPARPAGEDHKGGFDPYPDKSPARDPGGDMPQKEQ
ncbi:hypothetical protein AA103196_1035 [Ameyamaea chiangmaiensis NBRC 103196]|uniref:Uncharacterized protein n=1 Tax=Ameyamaea chiangmaiensis TaxID=442969 RepID=A0A850PCZ6_9PROT|nr:hypothetical protein [Ameyamaea chiangmaiensis]MBS4074661.1 hypothetical protein [Ameyamaea chiangmaiensis]NVN40773.1 hypothetical protein [Ameyamaea chiangmaiensis]GBQ65029.1 hypothetical protein AA103196_1035 [Ameyamaea chiangmaiensis NBRC 103196]